jgi:hypothetical protein
MISLILRPRSRVGSVCDCEVKRPTRADRYEFFFLVNRYFPNIFRAKKGDGVKNKS